MMMAAPKLGLVAIGQTPRVDVTSTMRSVLGDDVELLEEGVLDGLDAASVAALAPGRDDPKWLCCCAPAYSRGCVFLPVYLCWKRGAWWITG